jgi:D-alanyl-D-alanine-carboxypeptidase/D-alanyl-D-alanine-endopeptidase
MAGVVICAYILTAIRVEGATRLGDDKSAAVMAEGDNPLRTEVDRAVQLAANAFFSQTGHVGLSVAVVENGITHFYNYGVTSKLSPQRPTRRSIYEIASITKTFTGALASMAILDGKMSLDDDFRRHLAEPYPNLEREGKPITLRTLAGHTSGLPKNVPDTDDLFRNADFDKLPNQLIERERDYDEPRYLKALHRVTLTSIPGSVPAYSNIGIKLIAFGLERVYGETYANLLEKHILKPLHMTRTGLVVARKDESLLVHGYGVSGTEMPHTLQNAGAAGGLYSTTEDLGNYVSWQLAERDPIVRKSHELIRGSIREYGVGLIWDEATVNGERRLWHSGGAYGMSSQMELFPDAKVGIALLANDGAFDTQNQLDKAAMTIRQAIKSSR